MGICKKCLSIALCLIIAGTIVFGNNCFALNSNAASSKYKVGDVIEFGSYPQKQVTDNSLISKLNSQAGEWKSYGYLKVGDMKTPTDYMRYKDVSYDGDKYRAVIFDEYRPHWTNQQYEMDENNSFQPDNGFYIGNVYWFKFDPIKWRVLDPSTGLVMCESVIDCQAYSNYAKYDSETQEWYNDNGGFASDWKTSSLRKWLNNEFYNLAFNDEQKANISITSNDNRCQNIIDYSDFLPEKYEKYNSADTKDNVYVLSLSEVINSSYGFNSEREIKDPARTLVETDYAKCQGLGVIPNEHEYNNDIPNWWLRNATRTSEHVCIVEAGYADDTGHNTNSTTTGVCPAMRIIDLDVIDAEDNPSIIQRIIDWFRNLFSKILSIFIR